MRIRRPVPLSQEDTLSDPNKILQWYNYAVGVLLNELPSPTGINYTFATPQSWRFQAAVHGYDPQTDPYRDRGESPPTQAMQDTYWNQCQHGSWFFVAWHRQYLYILEQILVEVIIAGGGPADWALPFWNYSDTSAANARELPWAFRITAWPDGTKNYLYTSARRRGVNEGTYTIPVADTNITTALGKDQFSSTDNLDSFGGGEVADNTHFARVTGAVENLPHNVIHNDIGGFSGWMSDPDLAALDPVFWCHHSNIDRLWALWNVDPSHLNPTDDPRWASNVVFPFCDANGAPSTMRCQDVVNIEALGYTYDGLPAQVPSFAAKLLLARVRPVTFAASSGAHLLRATSGARVSLFSESTPPEAQATARKEGGKGRVLLHLDGVSASGHGATVHVYINLPEGADASQKEGHHAGLLAIFGKAGAAGHPDGHSFVMDVTHLSDAGVLGYGQPILSVEAADDDCPEVSIGRFSLSAC